MDGSNSVPAGARRLRRSQDCAAGSAARPAVRTGGDVPTPRIEVRTVSPGPARSSR